MDYGCHKFVCWCRCCWNIPSFFSFLLLPTLFFSSSSFTTFVVASTVSPPTALTVSLKPTPSPLFYPQLALIVAGSLLLFAMGFLLKFLKGRKHAAAAGRADEEKGKDGEERDVRKFKWDEIKYLTKGFSRLIGQGGFSNVYLANLSGSNLGAVKILVGNDRLNQVFKQELDILTRIRHENIVKFLGYCDDQGAFCISLGFFYL